MLILAKTRPVSSSFYALSKRNAGTITTLGAKEWDGARVMCACIEDVSDRKKKGHEDMEHDG